MTERSTTTTYAGARVHGQGHAPRGHALTLLLILPASPAAQQRCCDLNPFQTTCVVRDDAKTVKVQASKDPTMDVDALLQRLGGSARRVHGRDVHAVGMPSGPSEKQICAVDAAPPSVPKTKQGRMPASPHIRRPLSAHQNMTVGGDLTEIVTLTRTDTHKHVKGDVDGALFYDGDFNLVSYPRLDNDLVFTYISIQTFTALPCAIDQMVALAGPQVSFPDSACTTLCDRTGTCCPKWEFCRFARDGGAWTGIKIGTQIFNIGYVSPTDNIMKNDFELYNAMNQRCGDFPPTHWYTEGTFQLEPKGDGDYKLVGNSLVIAGDCGTLYPSDGVPFLDSIKS